MSCSNNCGNCKSDNSEDNNKGHYVIIDNNFGYKKQIHISEYLKRSPKPFSDPTPLDQLCKCSESPAKMKRYSCINCIRSWVFAVSKDTIENAIQEYKNRYLVVDRIKECLKEKQETEHYGNCSCKNYEYENKK